MQAQRDEPETPAVSGQEAWSGPLVPSSRSLCRLLVGSDVLHQNQSLSQVYQRSSVISGLLCLLFL